MSGKLFKNLYSAWRLEAPRFRVLILNSATLLVFLAFNTYFWSPPSDFEVGSIIRIDQGSSFSEVAQVLDQENLIKSKLWLKIFIGLLGSTRKIKAGDYHFEKRLSLVSIAHRLNVGKYSLNPVKVTIPEGSNIIQVAEIFVEKFDLFDKEQFMNEAPEGYLFPDTYFFLPNVTAGGVIKRMNDQFESVITNLGEEIVSSGKKLEEVIIMASLVEEEAHTPKDRRIISGILWKRFEEGLPLQVDASFSYVNGKNTYNLTLGDLLIESPYNTYKYTGLPPTPISSPGLDSILASLEPEETEYLYFLSDLTGNVYYARDFDEHQLNRELYLRK